MAVVQISRIQNRRGKKLSQTGFPQLASGELGWAIDTQELYIGNGAVSEGAPAVGNTKLITEHDDILALVDLYEYQRDNTNIQTGELTTMPTRRALQDRLDDVVSVRSFGALGDGVADDTEALQRAIDELFLNSATKSNVSSRVVLYIEPGVYLISNEIRIPPYAHIVGAGIDSTVIRQTMVDSMGFAVFRMVDSESVPGDYIDFNSISSLTTSWPRKIFISALTLETTDTNTVMYLDDTESSVFERVKFLGSFVNGNTADEIQTGVTIRGTGEALRTENVSFLNCQFVNTGHGVYSDEYGDHQNVYFDNCLFYQLFSGISVGNPNAEAKGSIGTKITNSFFDLIDQYGFRVKNGYGNISMSNTYMNVGNNNDSNGSPSFPVILFESEQNLSTNDYFDRNRQLKKTNLFNTVPYLPSVNSSSMVYDNIGYRVTFDDVTAANAPQPMMRFPLYESSVYIIEYVIKKITSGTAIRTGTLTITGNMEDQNYSIVDNFNYTGDSSVEDIQFVVEIENLFDDSFNDTLSVKYLNPNGNGSGTVNYSYRTMTS